jgi:uncharacterized membrane protein YgcG
MNVKRMCRLALLVMILISSQSANILAYPDYVGYVNDYAHLLSAPQASSLNQELRDFDNRTTIEVAVVTVDSIGGESPQDYAVNIANYWGVGKRDKDNGIIFLVAMDSHDIWIEVGPGLASQFTNRQVQQIVDNVIIPRFQAGQPDQGIIEGVHSIIRHFDSIGATSTMPITEPSPSTPITTPLPRADGNGSSNSIWSLAAILVIACLGGIFGFRFYRQSKAKKNETRLVESRKLFDEMVGKESAAIDALKELKGNYAPSIWKKVEESFNAVDTDKLELGLLEAERVSKQGWSSASKAQSLIDEWENNMESALKAIDAVPEKLAEVKSAQQKSATILAGLEAAFLHADRETAGNDISIATRKDLEKARQIYRDSSSMASQPANTVDWIMLLDQLTKLEEAVEKVSKDAARDKGIAQRIQGQDPDDMLAKMKQMLDDAEEKLGKSDEAREDLDAARENYARARGYRSGDLNAIDLYIIMMALNNNVSQGYRHQEVAVERARSRQTATAVHHTGFGRSGSGSFGGGRMGGGSRGGGKW